MERDFLQKRISQKAAKRFEQDWEALVAAIRNNPIGQLLKVTIDGISRNIADDTGVPLLRGRSPEENTPAVTYTNYSDTKAKLIQRYEQEELDVILHKLASLDYLFND